MQSSIDKEVVGASETRSSCEKEAVERSGHPGAKQEAGGMFGFPCTSLAELQPVGEVTEEPGRLFWAPHGPLLCSSFPN